MTDPYIGLEICCAHPKPDGQQDSIPKQIYKVRDRCSERLKQPAHMFTLCFGFNPCSAAKPTTAFTQQTTSDATSRFGAA
jgi:hypothetical protein